MNEEPTYVFRPGSGWVPVSSIEADNFVCMYTDCTGNVYRVEKRSPAPNEGEFWTALTPTDRDIFEILSWYTQTRTPVNLVAWYKDSVLIYKEYFVFVPI